MEHKFAVANLYLNLISRGRIPTFYLFFSRSLQLNPKFSTILNQEDNDIVANRNWFNINIC